MEGNAPSMGLGGTLLWPVYRFADWADDNPMSAVGAVVAVGATAALIVSAGTTTAGPDGGGQTLAIDGLTTAAILQAALARPAYPVVALVGLAVVALYDG